MFKSSDGGASWIRFSDGLSNRNVRALALAPGASGPNILYAGTSGAGVFKILDDGLVTDPFPVSRTFFVPIIVSSPGVGGAFYESELTLANRSTRDATVEFTYTAAFGGGSGQARTTLEAGRQRIAPDAIAYLRQLGIPIPASGSLGGTLRVRFYGLPSPDDAAVFVRTTTRGPSRRGLPGPTNGLLGRLQAVRAATGCFLSYQRGAAERRRGTRRKHHPPLAGVFQQLSSRIRRDSLTPRHSPGGFYQINEILHSNGLALSSGYVSVERINGYAPFYAYAVIHNQAGSDAFYVPPSWEVHLA